MAKAKATSHRVATVSRKTAETEIVLTLALDGRGQARATEASLHRAGFNSWSGGLIARPDEGLVGILKT